MKPFPWIWDGPSTQWLPLEMEMSRLCTLLPGAVQANNCCRQSQHIELGAQVAASWGSAFVFPCGWFPMLWRCFLQAFLGKPCLHGSCWGEALTLQSAVTYMAYPLSEKRFRVPCMALNNGENSPPRITQPGSPDWRPPASAAAVNWPSVPCFQNSFSHFFHCVPFLVYFLLHILSDGMICPVWFHLGSWETIPSLCLNTRCVQPSWAL